MNNFIESFKPKWNSFKESMYLLARNKLSLLAFAIIILLVLSAIFAPVIVPYPEDVYSTHIEQKLEAPSSEHIMGTDELGRDVFSRLVYGARVSISTALIAVGVALVIGIPLGAIAGTFGGWVDNVIMRITDVFLSFPPLLLAIALDAASATGSLFPDNPTIAVRFPVPAEYGIYKSSFAGLAPPLARSALPPTPCLNSLIYCCKGFIDGNGLSVFRLLIAFRHHCIELIFCHAVACRELRNGKRVRNTARHNDLPIQCVDQHRDR